MSRQSNSVQCHLTSFTTIQHHSTSAVTKVCYMLSVVFTSLKAVFTSLLIRHFMQNYILNHKVLRKHVRVRDTKVHGWLVMWKIQIAQGADIGQCF